MYSPEQEMPSPESLEALRGLEGLDAQEIVALNVLNEQQADILHPGYTASAEVESNATDFSIQVGNKLTVDGDKQDVDEDAKKRLGADLAEASNGNEAELRKTVRQSEFIIENALGGVDIEVDDKNKLFTQLEADFAEQTERQQAAGGAAELSATAAEQMESTIKAQTARSLIEQLHANPQTFLDLDDDLRAHLAPVVAIDRQNGSISDNAAKKAGEEIFASKGGSDIDLSAAA